MACVLVQTDVADGQLTPAASAVLGEARRIASSLGASVYAVAFVADADPDGMVAQALTATLGRGGADRAIVVDDSPGPSLWITRGPPLARICEQLRPSLVILPADAGGRDIAPRLAARMGAAFVAEPTIETGPRGEVVLARAVYDGDLWRRLQLDELDQPAVITLSPDHGPAAGEDQAELVRLDVGKPGALEIVARVADADRGLAQARIVVVAGAGVTPTAMPLIERLARQLGAELVGTRAVSERGQLATERAVGVGARAVWPSLYVVCGASGSMAHLGAVAAGAEIVAIDRDARAPIWKAARWGLVGAVEDVVPAFLAALETTA